ncbi:MAG: protein kinase [Myxococcota bacterium]
MTLGSTHEGTGPHYSTIPVDREPRIPDGTRLVGGDLEVITELARGGMSVVYRARDHRHGGREVVLKVVATEVERANTEARFRNEARLGASLAQHPHVVSPIRYGQLDGPAGFEGRMYLVTDLVEGTSLDHVMGTHRVGLNWRRACSIARDIARALIELHARGIVHRDIKPGNVLITRNKPECAKLIDFGLSYATGEGWAERSPDLTQQGRAPGTVIYMAPEQVAHKRPTPSMDIYSLGVMLYELFAGNPPYHRLGRAETLARKCDPQRSPFPLTTMCPELDKRLAALVHQCLAYDPGLRPDAAEVARMLETVLGVSSPTADHEPSASRPRWRLLVFATVIAAVYSRDAWWPPSRVPEPVSPASAVAAPGTAAHTPDSAEQQPAKWPQLGSTEPSEPVEPPPTQPTSKAPPPIPAQTSTERPLPDTPPTSGAPTTPRPSPKRRRPQRGRKPDEHSNEPRAAHDRCPDDVPAAAESAAKARNWRQVLQSTQDQACWTGARQAWASLRTRALFEMQRYADCIRVGSDSRDPSVVRWVSICRAHSNQDHP